MMSTFYRLVVYFIATGSAVLGLTFVEPLNAHIVEIEKVAYGKGTSSGIGDDAPGTVLTFRFFDDPSLNASGQVTFSATTVFVGDPIHTGVWVGSPGNLALAALSGDVAPGTGGLTFERFFIPRIDGSGHISFRAELDTSNFNTDIIE